MSRAAVVAHCCPRILVSGRWGASVDCRCGWSSRVVRNTRAASVLWAEHVATAGKPSQAETEGGRYES